MNHREENIHHGPGPQVAIKAMKKVTGSIHRARQRRRHGRMLSTHFAAFKDIFEDQDKRRAGVHHQAEKTVEG